MANLDHINILKKGVEHWNQWRKKHPEVQPNLSGPNFPLRNYGLVGADLNSANLCEADLHRANLSNASLRHANLERTEFYKTNLKCADGTGVRLKSTVFHDTDLGDVKGLDSCEHLGPSEVDIDTFRRSYPLIPLEFLRGVGWSQRKIDLAISLIRVLETLKQYEDELRRRGVRHAAVFGSAARAEARSDSDVDVLVDLDPRRPMGLFEYARLKMYIRELLRDADVVNRKTLKPLLRDAILREAVDAF